MINLLIIGARGFGREYHSGIMTDPEYGKWMKIKGFLDDKADALDGFTGFSPIIGPVETYEPQPDDMFICALGDSVYRKKYVDIIRKKGGRFMTMIDPRSIVDPLAVIGEGCMIGPFCCISANTNIGAFTTIQPYTNIGHDVTTGEFCSIESFTFIGGGSKIGENVTLHTRSTILPRLEVGDNTIVGAGSVVLRNVPPSVTVFGVPAKRVSF